jgi:hypothetical protein
MEPGIHTLGVTISDPDTSVQVVWTLDVRELSTNLEAFPEPGSPERSIQIYPNPFSELVHMRYLLPFDADVTVEISDLMGRSVWEQRSGRQPAGTHLIHWNGLDRQHAVVPVGIYVVRFMYRAGDQSLIQERKIVYTR